MKRGLVASLAVGLLLGACGGAGPSASARPEVTVFAAASLARALEAAASRYVNAGGASLTVSIGASSALRTQIEQGAPADLFLSADTTNPRRLADAGLAESEPVVFATNRLTVIATAVDAASNVASPLDLADPGLRVIAAGNEVPITGYAREVIGKLGRLPGYPSDFAARYEANVVSREDDVRSVVARIALGEGDAAIVYATDATAERVRSIPIPAQANVIAPYAGIVIRGGQRTDAARVFLDWLRGPDGQRVLGDFGFGPPP